MKRLIGKIYYEENEETGFCEAFIVWSFDEKLFNKTMIVDCIVDVKNQSLRDMYGNINNILDMRDKK